MRFRWFAVLLLPLIAAHPVSAHHSFAMFDTENEVRLEATVTSFQWTNPHVYIDIDYMDGGTKKHYLIECASISILKREGWVFNILKPGDKVTVIIAPLRDKQPGGLLKQIKLADGRKLGNGPGAGKPKISID